MITSYYGRFGYLDWIILQPIPQVVAISLASSTMLRGVFGGHRATASTTSLNALDEANNLEEAMFAASYMMDDEIERAEEELAKGSSVFHKHGRAVVIFLRAVLGFEREVMKEAQERIADAESAASAAEAHAKRDPGSSSAKIYSPGTEYALILAELRLMSAVTGVLTESVTEALKGFYKLRQAYLVLDAIAQEEARYLEKHGINSEDDTASSSQSSAAASKQDLAKDPDVKSTDSTLAGEDSDDEFQDADEAHDLKVTEKYQGRLSTDVDEVRDDVDKMTIKEQTPQERFAALRRKSSTFQQGPGMEVFGDNVVDGFIHSGSNMCFGIIQILISMLPPAFNTLIKIVGFRGDRIRGLNLLWQATKFTNINGAFAGLVLLGYYNGFVGFCDILPTHGRGAHPKARCAALLKSFRARYPKSRLWILEEARMLSSERKLDEAIQLLDDTPDANLKQVRALQAFEKSLSYMSSHRYELCSEGFQRCVKLNNWSHGLYYYVASVAWVERYRELKDTDPAKAADAKTKATDLLRKTPEHIGKKKMMGRQLPFDAFVGRKLQKWEHRAKEWNCDLIDAVGVAPLEEMIYFWNGYKRMNTAQLEFSLEKIKWSIGDKNPTWDREGTDEKCILKLLGAAVHRNMGAREQAREFLMEIILHPWHEIKGGLKDNWTLPVAHYEMAVIYWKDYTEGEGDMDSLREAQSWLEKAAAWEAYDLDAR